MEEQEAANYFTRRIAYLLKTESFRKKLPTLKSDIQDALAKIQNEPDGVTNPFESVYRIVFKLTIRMVAADEIANDENPY